VAKFFRWSRGTSVLWVTTDLRRACSPWG